MNLEQVRKALAFMGEIHDVKNVLNYKIVKLFENKISNRTRDEYGYHILLPNGNLCDTYFPTETLCLLAIACLESGKSLDSVFYMARVAGIEGNLAKSTEAVLDHEGFVPVDICAGKELAGRKAEIKILLKD